MGEAVWGTVNPNLRTLTADEKTFLTAIKEEPKTTRELATEYNLGADAEQDKARSSCKRLGFAEYGPLPPAAGAGPTLHRWRITSAGRIAVGFGYSYLKPLVRRARRAPNGTKALKKRTAAKRKTK